MKPKDTILIGFMAIFLFSISIIVSGENNENWDSEFLKADIHKKRSIIEQALSSDNIPVGFLSDIINTEKYRDSFPSPDGFTNFQSYTAFEMGKNATEEICMALKEFYYGGKRERILNRPRTFSFDYDWQKRVCEITDSSENQWALIHLWWYGCREDLWLVVKRAGGDIWEGPWFTGIEPGSYSDSLAYKLDMADDGIHAISQDGSVNRSISPETLTHDSDGDGLYDIEENRFGTDPNDHDSDHDGIPDGADVNPLSPGVKSPTPWGYARMAVFRLAAHCNYTFNVYLVSLQSNPGLEFSTSSHNAIIIPMDKTDFYRDNDRCSHGLEGGLRAGFSLDEQTDSTIDIWIRMQNKSTCCRVEKIHDVWVVTDQLHTIQY